MTRAELETPRRAFEYVRWVFDRYEKIEIEETNAGSKALRTGKGFVKKLKEEAFPLATFCQHHFGRARLVLIQHVLGKPDYDAQVTDDRARKSPIKFVEITQAHEGIAYHRRMQRLNVDNDRRVFRRDDETREDAFDRIRRAVNRKAKNRYRRGTALLIVFDDHISFLNPENIEALKHFVRKDLLPELRRFCWVALVGWSRRICLEFDPNAC